MSDEGTARANFLTTMENVELERFGHAALTPIPASKEAG